MDSNVHLCAIFLDDRKTVSLSHARRHACMNTQANRQSHTCTQAHARETILFCPVIGSNSSRLMLAIIGHMPPGMVNRSVRFACGGHITKGTWLAPGHAARKRVLVGDSKYILYLKPRLFFIYCCKIAPHPCLLLHFDFFSFCAYSCQTLSL